MIKSYGLIADLHCHTWSAFATLDSEGRNSRLMAIVNELLRCAEETKKAGGDLVVIAGDLFHVRGSVSPEVFNPVKEALAKIADMNMWVMGIPGNHDLTSKESDTLGSSVAMLNNDSVEFCHSTQYLHDYSLVVVPWMNNIDALLAELQKIENRLGAGSYQYDVIIHRGIDGTLDGMPGKGMTADKLKEFSFKRVFAGDYHNHKDFGRGIYSIGAVAHHTWGDIGTKAGFLVVHPEHVQWFCSHAPQFIDVTEAEDADDLALLADGQYVRARIGAATAAEVAEMRKSLLEAGARGVLIESVPATTEEKREGVTIKSLDSIDKSVTDYIAEKGMRPEVSAICDSILKECNS